VILPAIIYWYYYTSKNKLFGRRVFVVGITIVCVVMSFTSSGIKLWNILNPK